MRAGHVTSTGERRGAYRIWQGNPRVREHLEGLRIDGKIILK
jgi:hypothetical protein